MFRHFSAKFAPICRKQVLLPDFFRVELRKCEVFKAFFSYAWMGNVRELEKDVERMVVLSGDETLSLKDVPENIKNPESASDNLWFSLPAEPINLESVEAEIIRAALNRFGGNQSRTARYLGITRSALIYRMQKYGLTETG